MSTTHHISQPARDAFVPDSTTTTTTKHHHKKNTKHPTHKKTPFAQFILTKLFASFFLAFPPQLHALHPPSLQQQQTVGINSEHHPPQHRTTPQQPNKTKYQCTSVASSAQQQTKKTITRSHRRRTIAQHPPAPSAPTSTPQHPSALAFNTHTPKSDMHQRMQMMMMMSNAHASDDDDAVNGSQVRAPHACPHVKHKTHTHTRTPF